MGVSAAMIEAAKKGLPVFSVSSDLPGSTGVAGFQSQFPEQTYDVGVAESNMISVAAGLSKEGFIPVVDTFAQFGTTKGALPLLMANLSHAPMIAIFSHAGFQDAADGASHQSLNYINLTAGLPNTEVIVLSTSAEAKALVAQAIEQFFEDRKAGRVPKTYIFFLGRETFICEAKEKLEYKLTQGQVVLDNSNELGQSVTISAAGPLLHQALKAAEGLKAKGIGSIVINPSTINHPDLEIYKSALAKTKGRLVTVEDHQKIGGMGAILSQALKLNNVEFKLKSLAVQGEYGQSAYLADELYSKHKLDFKAIEKAAEQLV